MPSTLLDIPARVEYTSRLADFAAGAFGRTERQRQDTTR